MADRFKVDRGLVQGMTKKERHEFVRAARREERERVARVRRRRRITGWTAAGAAAVVVVGATVYAVNAGAQARAAEAEAAAKAAANAGPANMLTDGLQWVSAGDESSVTYTPTDALAAGDQPTTNASTVSTTGVLDLQVYLDPTSAEAATFWKANADTLESYVVAGYVTLELHPVALDTTNSDAVAAVAAFGCVADAEPDVAWSMWSATMQYGIDGLDTGATVTATDLATAASTAGVSAADATDCIGDGGFTPWAKAASVRAATSVPYTADGAGVASGALVVAAGSVYTGDLGDATALASFLNDAYSAAAGSE